MAVRKNGDRDISEVKFQKGETATIEQAIVMAEQDLIEDLNTCTTGDINIKCFVRIQMEIR